MGAGRPGAALRGFPGSLQHPSPSAHSLGSLLWLEAPGGTDEPAFPTSTRGTKPWDWHKVGA